MIIDDVAIAARRGAEPGVKIRRYMFDPTHRDVTGKFAFTPASGGIFPLRPGFEMHHGRCHGRRRRCGRRKRR